MRLFVALEIPKEAREHLVRLIRKLSVVDLGGRRDVRWVRPESLHITLKFLGELRDSQVPDLCTALTEVRLDKPIPLNADRTEFLPPRGFAKIFCATLAGDADALARLIQEINAACGTIGLPDDAHLFNGHITLGRVRSLLPDLSRRLLTDTAAKAMPGPLFHAGGFSLIQSELLKMGPRYTTLARFPNLT